MNKELKIWKGKHENELFYREQYIKCRLKLTLESQ